MRTGYRLFLALAFLLIGTPAMAQEWYQCNHCGYTDQCPLFDHWENCGADGPGLDWQGYCNPGCNELDCSYVIPLPRCNPTEAPEADSPSPEALDALVASLQDTEADVVLDLVPLAAEAGLSRIELDPTRRALYLRTCAGSELVGQVLVDEATFERLLELPRV